MDRRHQGAGRPGRAARRGGGRVQGSRGGPLLLTPPMPPTLRPARWFTTTTARCRPREPWKPARYNPTRPTCSTRGWPPKAGSWPCPSRTRTGPPACLSTPSCTRAATTGRASTAANVLTCSRSCTAPGCSAPFPHRHGPAAGHPAPLRRRLGTRGGRAPPGYRDLHGARDGDPPRRSCHRRRRASQAGGLRRIIYGGAPIAADDLTRAVNIRTVLVQSTAASKAAGRWPSSTADHGELAAGQSWHAGSCGRPTPRPPRRPSPPRPPWRTVRNGMVVADWPTPTLVRPRDLARLDDDGYLYLGPRLDG